MKIKNKIARQTEHSQNKNEGTFERLDSYGGFVVLVAVNAVCFCFQHDTKRSFAQYVSQH